MVTFQPFLKSKQIRSILTTGNTILQICASTPKCIVIIYAQFFKFSLRNLIIFSFKNLSVHKHNIISLSLTTPWLYRTVDHPGYMLTNPFNVK